jgi:hypothetical protein
MGEGHVPVDQMGRTESSDFERSAPQHVRGIVADGSLAIGTRNVNGLPWKLNILQQQTYPLQTRLDHVRRTLLDSHAVSDLRTVSFGVKMLSSLLGFRDSKVFSTRL